MSKRKPKYEVWVPPWKRMPMSVTTFRDCWDYTLGELALHNEPSSFNCNVTIRQYRVTVELVDEPVEVLQARVRKLWRECDNVHHWGPLEHVAKELGMTLDRAECGVDRKAKR